MIREICSKEKEYLVVTTKSVTADFSTSIVTVFCLFFKRKIK